MDNHVFNCSLLIFLLYILTVSVAVIPSKYRIAEEQAEGTFVADIKTDSGLDSKYEAEIAALLTFSFRQEGGVYDLFEIHPTTGVIRTRQVIDRESLIQCHHTNTCDLHLSVSVKPLQYFEIFKIVIEIEDINDNIPTFPERRINWSITETTRPKARFVVPSAEDHDSGVFGIQKYNLTAYTTNKFKLQLTNHTDGSIEVALVLEDALDREHEQFYPIKITAWDGGSPEQSGSLLIDIMIADANDNNPTFSNGSYEVSVYEDVQPDSVVATVHASDPDSGLNGDVIYSLAPNTHQELGDLFAINNKTGEVSVTGELDYEQETIYELQVMASDLGSHSLPAFCKVIITVMDVNDHGPDITFNTFIDSGHAEVEENADFGAFVAHVSVSDPDLGESGNFDCDLSSPLFALEELADTDNSAEYMIVTAATFDREKEDQYRVTLTCTDKGQIPMSSSARIIVDIQDDNDHSPTFSQESYKVSLSENNEVGVSISRIRASDSDSGGNGAVRYSLQSLNPQDIVENIVSIDAISGEIKAEQSFDRERRSHYEFLVLAADHGVSGSKTASTVLSLTIDDINDEYPQFEQLAYPMRVQENLPANSLVGAVLATDGDGPDYNQIIYSIDNHLSETDAFDIDTETGQIITTRSLNREEQDSFTLAVFATNVGFPDISTRVNVTVTIVDENDNDPQILFPSSTDNTLQLDNNIEIGQVITRVRAEDADIGVNQVLQYSITNGNNDGVFAIDSQTGAITIAGSLENYQHKAIKLVISVSDTGVPKARKTFGDLNILVAPPASAQSGLLHGSNFMILIGVVCGAIFIIVIIIIAILCTKFRSRHSKKGHRYNCQVEANKRLSNGSLGDGDITKDKQLDSDLEFAPTVDCDLVKDKDMTIKKEVTFNMDKEDLDNTPHGWPLNAHEAGLLHQQVRLNFIFILFKHLHLCHI